MYLSRTGVDMKYRIGHHVSGSKDRACDRTRGNNQTANQTERATESERPTEQPSLQPPSLSVS